MGLWRKIRLPDTQFLQNEYLKAGFFSIDPYSYFYALFVANLVSHNTFFLHRPKTQNAHGGWNVLPKMFVGRWWYFLEKCWKTGWSEQDVRDRRMLPWMATVAVPVRIRTATHFSLENSHRETSHRGRTFRSPWAFVASSLTLNLHL